MLMAWKIPILFEGFQILGDESGRRVQGVVVWLLAPKLGQRAQRHGADHAGQLVLEERTLDQRLAAPSTPAWWGPGRPGLASRGAWTLAA
jgi:hypothetical protein